MPQSIETPKNIEYKTLKFIKKPESDLERLFNSLVKFFREESNFRIVKNYCFPLGNKLRNYKNNSAFEEFYKTSKRCKQDLIPLLKDLLSSDIYIRESKENSLLNGSIHIILKFLEDNKTKFIVHSAQAKNESDEESQDDKIITKPIKFIRNKYFKSNSKLKPYIVNNLHLYDEQEDGIMSDYLTGNREELKKMNVYCKNKERAMSSYNQNTNQKVDNVKYKEEHNKIHFKSIASYMYQLEKVTRKMTKTTTFIVMHQIFLIVV